MKPVKLTPATHRRLIALHAATVGAKAAVDAAVTEWQRAEHRYEDALHAVYAERGIDPAWHVSADLATGTLTRNEGPPEVSGGDR